MPAAVLTLCCSGDETVVLLLLLLEPLVDEAVELVVVLCAADFVDAVVALVEALEAGATGSNVLFVGPKPIFPA